MPPMKPHAPQAPILATPEALFRFRVVSQVLADVLSGRVRAEAVRRAATADWWTCDGILRNVTRRTLYRWLRAYDDAGIAGIEPAKRARISSSTVLPEPFLALLARTKEADPRISIPEIIRIGRETGLIEPDAPVDRTTVYRAARRMGLAVRRRKTEGERDARRFAYPHRMDCILCDGKHFRAGATRARRVALFFLDDASRLGLHVVVGTSESTALFLRGLYETVRLRGLPIVVFLDGGPGFISDDTAEVIRRLGGLLIHGTARYPQGHGKIEKFNQTALGHLLRGLDHRPDVDPDCGALDLRLQHWLREIYNHTPHESLDSETPWQRFEADAKPLRFPDSDANLRQRFVLTLQRRVSNDHVVSVDSIHYEMPRGYAGAKVTLLRGLLDGRLGIIHQGRVINLHPVDLARNARDRRGQRSAEPADQADPIPVFRAADHAFLRDFQPVVGPDGGFTDSSQE